jgi:hypothetical protein
MSVYELLSLEVETFIKHYFLLNNSYQLPHTHFLIVKHNTFNYQPVTLVIR